VLLQRKFLLAISMVILSFSIIIYTLVITSNKVQNQAPVENDTLTSKLLSMLTITDSIMFERVKSSMKLLIERGSADQAPELAPAVDVRGSIANNLAVNAMEQASQFELVDNLMPLWAAQRHCLAAMVTSICVYAYINDILSKATVIALTELSLPQRVTPSKKSIMIALIMAKSIFLVTPTSPAMNLCETM
jgi:uncharacterized membrane protein